ncbi:hypothetical protein TCDM_09260 [Trypanosoma cruzi Dm28c]|uniref:Uncharacterized protein n=1 Tax=Trypanosoma cruzi Dm28c TaxID=1416333 RepID=V5B5U9_TRYCR|nr:hypothetical protein TCDM_09260 [Trypanosoma cruzi Dm28c]
MPAAVSVVATCAAEHCLSISADGSGAALFCIASHGQSDEDTADHRLGGGNPRVNPTLCVCSAMRLIDTSILFGTSPSLQGRPCHAAIGCGWAQELARPSTPCDPFSLDASTVRCTTAVRRPHRVRSPLASTAWRCGTAKAARHRLSHAYQRRILLSTWPSIQHRCGGSLGSAHPHSTNASHVSVVLMTCVAQSAWKPHLRQYLGRQRRPFRCREMPSSRNCDASAATWGSPRTTSAPLMLSTEFSLGTLRAAAGWASSGHGTPRTPWTVSDDRPLKRPVTLWDLMTQAAGRTARCLSLSMHLDPPHCHFTPRTAELPVGPHRTAAGSLACTCRAECPVTEHGLGQLPVPRLAAAASQSPIRVPVATDSLSAMESLRLGLLAVHDDVSEEICTVPHSPAD